ncbi:hypothetical protein BH10CYA1_BH10CYA1_07210 [soil metagenome]
MRLFKGLIVTAIVGSLINCTPAYSADISGLLQQFSSSVHSWGDLESRLSQLDQQIDQGRANGSLSSLQAEDFKVQTQKLKTQELQAQTMSSRMSFADMFTYTNSINVIANQVDQAMRNRQTAVPDVGAYQAQLKQQIISARSSGQLTQQDADKLNQDLRSVADLEAGFRSTGDGSLNPKQAELLVKNLDRVKASITQQIAVSQSAIPELTQRRESLTTKINQASTAGTITAQQAGTFNTDLGQIATTQQGFSAQGTISGSQIYSLATSLDRLEAKIDQAVAAHGTVVPPVSVIPDELRELNLRREGLNKKIADATASGAISSQQSAGLNAEVAQIYATQQGYTTQGAFTGSQAYNLLTSIERLETKVDQSIAARAADSLSYRGPYNDYPSSRDYSSGHREDPVDAGRDYRSSRGGESGHGQGRDYGSGRGNDSAHGQGRGYGDESGYGSSSRNDQSANLSTNQPPVYTSVQPATTGSSTYRDVQGFWGEPYISELASRGIIGGFPDGTFKPNDQITRAQFAAIAAKALAVPSGGSASFRDVPARYWANSVIGAVSGAGLVTGFPDGTFRPEDKLTRAQALIILVKGLRNSSPNPAEFNEYTDYSEVPAWAQSSVSAAAGAHIIVNFPNTSLIRPNDLATRGEVAALTYQTLLNLGRDLPSISIGVLHPNRR